MVVLKNGNTGIGTNAPTEKLQVSGNVLASNVSVSSDVRFKENIAPIKGALDKVDALNGVYYDWKTDDYKDRNFDESRQIGFIAQDLEKVLPEVVKTDAAGWKSVSYDKLTALLVEALKESNTKNKTQQASIDELIKLVQALSSQNLEHKAELSNLNQQMEALIQANELDRGTQKVQR